MYRLGAPADRCPGARRGAASGRARRARAQGRRAGRSCCAANGDLVRLAPGTAGVIDEVPAGRLYKDGALLVDAAGDAPSRTAAGSASPASSSVAMALDEQGRARRRSGDRAASASRRPTPTATPMREIAYDAVRRDASSSCRARAGAIPMRSRRRCARAVRAAVAARLGQEADVPRARADVCTIGDHAGPQEQTA